MSGFPDDEVEDATPKEKAAQASEATGEAKPYPKRRGFAAMDPKVVAEIARKGGVAAHKAGTAHRFSTEEGRSAGKKGGNAPHVRRGRQQAAPPVVADLPKEPLE